MIIAKHFTKHFYIYVLQVDLKLTPYNHDSVWIYPAVLAETVIIHCSITFEETALFFCITFIVKAQVIHFIGNLCNRPILWCHWSSLGGAVDDLQPRTISILHIRVEWPAQRKKKKKKSHISNWSVFICFFLTVTFPLETRALYRAHMRLFQDQFK